MTKLSVLITVFTLLISVTFAHSAAPANDMFTNQIIIAGSSGTITGINLEATIEIGEPQPGGFATIWWSWTAPASGGCEFNTCGSSFDTYLAIYTGASVDALSLIAENDDYSSCGDSTQSKVCFDVTAGQTYQIQVSGSYDNESGGVVLFWQLGGNLSDWILDSSETNIDFSVHLAYDSSALSYEYTPINNKYYRTNDLGCKTWRYDYLMSYPNGFSISDKNNNKKIENKPLEGIGNNSSVKDYNGKLILVYDRDSKKLIVNAVNKDTFVKFGEREINDFEAAEFNGSDIYVYTRDRSSSPEKNGLQAFDKKLKKLKWSELPAEGNLHIINMGITAREIQVSNTVEITCKIKGRKIMSNHLLIEPPGTTLHYKVDKRGGVLYWIVKSNTNYPLTYIDKKGKKVVDYQSPADAGVTWNLQSCDGKLLYISKEVSASNYIFYVYKIKELKKLGQQAIDLPRIGFASTAYFEKQAYIIPAYNDSGYKYAAYVFDKKLKNSLWIDDYDYGMIWKLGKNTLVRRTSSTSGDIVTLVYKLFNKKGEIVTHTFNYVE